MLTSGKYASDPYYLEVQIESTASYDEEPRVIAHLKGVDPVYPDHSFEHPQWRINLKSDDLRDYDHSSVILAQFIVANPSFKRIDGLGTQFTAILQEANMCPEDFDRYADSWPCESEYCKEHDPHPMSEFYMPPKEHCMDFRKYLGKVVKITLSSAALPVSDDSDTDAV